MSEACPSCGHPITLSRCWRLTCPSNGARESAAIARPGEGYEAAKRASAARAREIMIGHPSTWGEPPDPEFML